MSWGYGAEIAARDRGRVLPVARRAGQASRVERHVRRVCAAAGGRDPAAGGRLRPRVSGDRGILARAGHRRRRRDPMRPSPWLLDRVPCAASVLVLALDLGVCHCRRAGCQCPRGGTLDGGLGRTGAGPSPGAIGRARATPQMLTFLTGYLIEESLSADNVFVIALIFASFRIPAEYQHRVLFWGIFGALVCAARPSHGRLPTRPVRWAKYIGAVVLVAAVRLVVRRDEGFGRLRGPLMRGVQRVLPVATRSTASISDARSGDRTPGRDAAAGGTRPGRVQGPRVRDGLDPGDLRDHARHVSRLHVQRLRALRLRSLYFLLADACAGSAISLTGWRSCSRSSGSR